MSAEQLVEDSFLNAQTPSGSIRDVLRLSADPVRDYVSKLDEELLSAEQEVELMKRIEAGLVASELLNIREAEDPLERLEVLERKANGGELVADPESFAQSLAPTLGRLSADVALGTNELQWLADDGMQARTHLIEANLKLVLFFAKRKNGRSLDFLDLVQAGNEGLMHGLQKFNYKLGYKFSTYVGDWINQYMDRAIDNSERLVRLPWRKELEIRQVARTKTVLMQSLGREPLLEEVGEKLGLDLEYLTDLERWGQTHASLDKLIDDSDSTLGDVIEIAPANILGTVDGEPADRRLQQALETLDPHARYAVEAYNGLLDGKKHKQADIAKELGLSRRGVSQLINSAMAELDAYAQAKDSFKTPEPSSKI